MRRHTINAVVVVVVVVVAVGAVVVVVVVVVFVATGVCKKTFLFGLSCFGNSGISAIVGSCRSIFWANSSTTAAQQQLLQKLPT